MIKKFQQYCIDKHLFTNSDKVLLAVSGGRDSMVLLDLFVKAGLTCGVAHCNFQLRNSESDGDENLVKETAQNLNLPFYSIRFETSQYAKNQGVSIQIAARELRYQWFEKLRLEHNFDYIATAHHANDSIETVFINLARGTSIKGLCGIKAKKDKIIRPLLFAYRNEIDSYCVENQIVYRDDSSNASTKYTRNKIRHSIIPTFESINPNFQSTAIKTIERLNQVEQIYLAAIEKERQNCVQEVNNQIVIDIEKLKLLAPLSTYLYEFLQPYHFDGSALESIIKVLDSESGKYFYSSSHCLLKDRNSLIISEIQTLSKESYEITEETDFGSLSLPIIKFRKLNRKDFTLKKDSKIACLDFDKLQFPLRLRKWQEGDWFYPLGMTQKKKLSDFFTDQKISRLDKEQIWLLTSDNQIVWIVGFRIDNRFKVELETQTICQLEAISIF